MLNSKKITRYLTPGHHVHLVGIGGVSMRPLGLVLKGMGMEVTGSDMNASVSTDELIEKGIPVAIGHRAENIEGADCIIRTAAAHNDNPEIAAARAAGSLFPFRRKNKTGKAPALQKAGAFRLPRKPCTAWLPFCSQNETTSCAGLAQVVILSTYSTGPSP